jgi:hypothetical protein
MPTQRIDKRQLLSPLPRSTVFATIGYSLLFPMISLTLASLAARTPIIPLQDSGSLISQTSEPEPPQPRALYYPKAYTGKRTAYDLEQDAAENRKKSQAGQAHNFSGIITKEFADHFYPKTKMEWYRQGRATLGVMPKEDDTTKEVMIHWFSLADGSQWGFSNTERTRSHKANPFAVISSREVEKKIRTYLEKNKVVETAEEAARCDVFALQSRLVVTGSQTSNLGFPNTPLKPLQYGVYYKEKVYFFTSDGEPTK